MDDLDAKWGNFMASSGVQLEEDILQSLQESRHILDIEDGTHASWYDNRLGTLLVFQHDEALSMIGAWHDADGGDLIALSRVLRWVSGFMDMLEQCLMLYDSFDDE